MMKPFSDENLTRAFRKSIGLSGEPDKARPKHEVEEEEALLKAELESLHKNPLGRLGKKFYRLMMKQWPKPDDNYDWVYKPGQLEVIPVNRVDVFSDESEGKTDPSLQTARTPITPIVPLSVVMAIDSTVAIADASNSSFGDEHEANKISAASLESLRLTDSDLALASTVKLLQLDVIKLTLLSDKVAINRRQAVGSDIVRGGSNLDLLFSPPFVWSRQYMVSEPFVGVLPYSGRTPIEGEAPIVAANTPYINRNELFEGAFQHLKNNHLMESEALNETVMFIDEAHRTHEAHLADIQSMLEAINQAMTAFQSMSSVGYTAVPRNSFQVAYDFIAGIFTSKKDEVQPANDPHLTIEVDEDGELETVNWTLEKDPFSALALRGSAGHFQDYWLKLANHQLSLRWHNKAVQSQPETIFQVNNTEPATAAMMMVAAFQNAHMGRESAMKLMGSVRDFVQRKAQVH